MNDYVICLDSSSDFTEAAASERDYHISSLTFRFNDSETEYSNQGMSITEFYDRMRAGGVAKTAAVNAQAFINEFEQHLKAGFDVLYIGFSSGLSTTYNSACIAATELREKYPERKIITVDTLAASAGIALLADIVLEAKKGGATIEEAAALAEEKKLHICHYFTVDDLEYLKRGGRVSPAVAFVGNMLGIKPLLYVDNDGHLTKIDKARGRHASLVALANKYGELAEDASGTFYISNGDCIEDARKLADIITAKYGATCGLITDVGPVIGAHAGPGVLALFFVGKQR